MAELYDEKPGRGLFGLGGRRASAATSVVPGSTRGPAGATGADQLAALNARALAASALAPRLVQAAPQLDITGLSSRPVTLAETHSGWFAYWAEQLRCRARPHRKLWEYAAVLQALYECGLMRSDAKMLGFGVGGEPLPSYLAGLGLNVVATDLPEAAERDLVLNPDFVPAEAFDARVEVSNLDMRRLDDVTLRGFDACWSCGVLNELKSADEAAETAIGTMDVLVPGGVAVHTADFAFADALGHGQPRALAFSRRFFEHLAEGLNGRGHKVASLSFDLGAHPLDAYVDREPFEVEASADWSGLWREGLGAPHLKLLQGDVMKTSFALVVQARS